MPAIRQQGIPVWTLPILAGLAWLATLLFMLITWAAKGSLRYPEEFPTQQWPYVSNTGATMWGKPVFITGSTVMVVLYCSTLGLERWYRHQDRLPHHRGVWTRIISATSLFCTAIGSCALVLLTIFDVRDYSTIHYSFVAVFLFGYLLAACFACIERGLLSHYHPTNAILRFSFRIKLFFVVTEIILVCAFGATMYQKIWGPSVVLEWIVGLFFTFYMWTFAADFYALPKRSRELKTIIRHWDEEGAIKKPRETKVRFGPSQYIELP